MSITMVGVFDDYDDAQRAVTELESQGISRSAIDISSGRDSGSTTSTMRSTGTMDSPSTLGSMSSSALGSSGETSAPASTASRQPDRRGFFARLFGLDEDEEDLGHYSEAVRRGSVVVSVRLDESQSSQQETVRDAMERCNAVDIDRRVEQWKASGYSGYNPDAPLYSEDEIARERQTLRSTGATDTGTTGTTDKLQVVQEELRVGKRAVSGGGVRVIRRTTETPVQEDVTLREERAVVERHAVDRPATAADLDQAFTESTIEVRETSEEAVVSKTARVVEEVNVGKEVSERTETVRDTVRRSDVEVEQLRGSDMVSNNGSTTSTLAGSGDVMNPSSTTMGTGGRYTGPERRMNSGASYTGIERRVSNL